MDIAKLEEVFETQHVRVKHLSKNASRGLVILVEKALLLILEC